MVYLFLADGFEEMETITAFDVLQRCGLEVKLLSITGKRVVIGGHGLILKVDGLFRKNVVENAQALVLPGGMPAAKTLLNCDLLRQALVQHNHKGTLLAAICAAPMVLGSIGLLEGKKATCYPGFEKYLTGATYTAQLFQEDGNIITGEGPAASLPYAYRILSYFVSEDEVRAMQHGMMYAHLMGTEA